MHFVDSMKPYMLKTLQIMLVYVLSFCLPPSASALNLHLDDIYGNTFNLSEYRGKWIVLSFWASWCPSCRAEVSELNSFYVHNRTRAIVLGVNIEDDMDTAELRLASSQFGIRYPVAKSNSHLEHHFGAIEVLPTTYILDPHGNIVGSDEGLITRDDLERFITTEHYN